MCNTAEVKPDLEYSGNSEVVLMKLIAFLLCAGLFVLVHASPARADEASKAAKIEELMMITHVDQMMKQMMDQMQSGVREQLKSLNLPAQASSDVIEANKRILAVLFDKMTWDKIKAPVAKIYADTLTEEEVEGAVAFYKSPVGQSLLQKTPLLLQRSMAFGQQVGGDTMPEVMKIMQELQSKYKK